MHILADLPKPPAWNHLWVIESQPYTNTYCIVATVGLYKVVTRSGRGQDYNYPHTFKTTWYVYTTHNKHCQALTLLLCFLLPCRGDRTRKSERHAVNYTTHWVYLTNMPHATTHTNATCYSWASFLRTDKLEIEMMGPWAKVTVNCQCEHKHVAMSVV